jgi:hypothetical protein
LIEAEFHFCPEADVVERVHNVHVVDQVVHVGVDGGADRRKREIFF